MKFHIYIIYKKYTDMEFIIGTTANIISTTLCHPIDVIKTHYQVKNSNIKDTLQHVMKNRIYFRGLSANLGTYPIFWGIYFQTNSMFDTSTLTTKFISSFICGNIGAFVANPLFVMKTRMQTSKDTYINTFKNIYSSNGIRGFYKGYPATMLNNSKLAVQFPLYSVLLDYTGNVAGSAALAKLTANTLLYPMDLVRVQQRNSTSEEKSIYNILYNIYKKSGVAGLYRGVGLYNTVSVLQFTVMMSLMSWFKNEN